MDALSRRRQSFRQVWLLIVWQLRKQRNANKYPKIASGEKNESDPESTCRPGSPPKITTTTSCPCLPSLVEVHFRVRQLFCIQNDRTNEKKRTDSDHITSALLAEVLIIIIIICLVTEWRLTEHKDVKIYRTSDLTDFQNTVACKGYTSMFYRKLYQWYLLFQRCHSAVKLPWKFLIIIFAVS